MLVCLEIAGTKLEELSGPLRTQDLVEKVQLHRERRFQDNDVHQGFTADDAKASLRAFAGSHTARARWLRIILGLKKNEPVEERLDEVTHTFFRERQRSRRRICAIM